MSFEEYYDTLPPGDKNEEKARADWDELKTSLVNLVNMENPAKKRKTSPTKPTFPLAPPSDYMKSWEDWQNLDGPDRIAIFELMLTEADKAGGNAERLFFNARQAALRADLDKITSKKIPLSEPGEERGPELDQDLEGVSDDNESWEYKAVRGSNGWPDLCFALQVMTSTNLAIQVNTQRGREMAGAREQGLPGATVPYTRTGGGRLRI